LSELADEWRETVATWRSLNAHLLDERGTRCPSRAHEYMLYQALLGAWPLRGIDAPFVERMQAYALKAAREGKQETNWSDSDERYEAGLAAFVEKILDANHSARFLQAFEPFARRVALLGTLKSLSQLVLKLTLPGVPDFYQGTEFWDLALVDPDNRRPVDFATRTAALASIGEGTDWSGLAASWPDARIKLALTRSLLSLRQQLPSVFTDGSYRPLEVFGSHASEVLAFARADGRNAVIVAVGRLFARASDGGRQLPVGTDWNATLSVEGFSSLQDALTLERMVGPQLPLSDLFKTIPVAVLQTR
jgi:(1->4)-alpha-D-glucan 1-alpha-D-glucosylmutase